MAMRAMIIPWTDADEQQVGGEDRTQHTLSRLRPEEDSPYEVVALEQVRGGALEADRSLVQEDGPVRDGQRDVQRLLDDDHRLSLALQALDDAEKPFDDDRGKTQRQLVDQQDLGLVQQNPRQRQHLLLAAREPRR